MKQAKQGPKEMGVGKRSADGGGQGQATHGVHDLWSGKRNQDGVAGDMASHGTVDYGKPNHASAEVDLKVGKRESVKDAVPGTHSGAGPGGSSKFHGRTGKIGAKQSSLKSGAGSSEPHA